MSCFIVSLNHINFLITAAFSFGSAADPFSFWHEKTGTRRILTPASANAIGQQLVDANTKSWNCRYKDSSIPEKFVWKPDALAESTVWRGLMPEDLIVDFPVSLGSIVKACHCFDYQACEYPQWPESKAYAFIQALIDTAIRQYPDYQDATWEIE